MHIMKVNINLNLIVTKTYNIKNATPSKILSPNKIAQFGKILQLQKTACSPKKNPKKCLKNPNTKKK